MKTGVNVKTIKRAKQAGGIGLAVVICGVVAVIGGMVWAGIVIATGVEIGYVAWGIGFVVGLVAVGCAQGNTGPALGMAAAGLAAFGLLVGKLMIFQWGAPAYLAKELAANDQLKAQVAVAVAINKVTGGDITDKEELKQAIPKDNKTLAKEFLSTIPVLDRIKMTMSFWDILWFGLALVTAWKMGAGSYAEE